MCKFVLVVLIAALAMVSTAATSSKAIKSESGLCLTDYKSDVVVAECTGKRSQQWRLKKLNGHYAIRNEWNKQCLAVGKRGAVVTQRCAHRSGQQFELKDIWMSDNIAIVHADTGDCLDVDIWDDEYVQWHDCHYGSNQQWKF